MSDCLKCAWYVGEECMHPDTEELHSLNACNYKCTEFDAEPEDHIMVLGWVRGTLPEDPEEGEKL